VNSKEIVVNDELLVKYLGGEASPEEAEALTLWMEKEENAVYFEEMESAWQAARPSAHPRAIDKQTAWAKVERSMKPIQSEVPVRPLFRNSFAWKIAAAVLIVSASALFYIRFSFSEPDSVVATQERSKRLQLSDQSVAILHHQTVLSYPEKFAKENREVTMQKGEAFFTIAPDKEHPFIIHTPAGTVRVIGTAFNLTLKEGQLEVGVSEGKVMIYTDTDTAYVMAGITARIHAHTIEVNDSVDVNTWAYATQKLVFRETSMSEVLRVIEKTYTEPVTVSNEQIRNCKLTASFDTISEEKLLTFIAESLNLSLTKNDNGYMLQGSGCP